MEHLAYYLVMCYVLNQWFHIDYNSELLNTEPLMSTQFEYSSMLTLVLRGCFQMIDNDLRYCYFPLYLMPKIDHGGGRSLESGKF